MEMGRPLFLMFGLLAYCVFFATFLYLIGFVADVAWLPRTVDHPAGTAAWQAAGGIDIALIALFGVQHSVMARAGFKATWTRIVPEPIERSTYVLFASIALIVLFLFWQPLAGDVWDVRGTPAEPILWALFGCGWLIVLLSTFLINHFELFGLSQVWNHMRSARPVAPVFRQPFFYKLVRHPLYSGFFIAFWATPHMSVGHALLAAGMSVYMLVAIVYEERDLVRLFGEDYEAYRLRVGKLTPRLRRAR
jgi:protein-S-isoprenylcysteine O-methyltransferase Ste14